MPRRDVTAAASGLDVSTERAILDATEALLGGARLEDLAVSAILSEAHVARATFYMYFSSKQAVLKVLFHRMLDEVYDVFTHTWAARDRAHPRDALRAALAASYELFAQHGVVARAAAELWLHDDEIGREFRAMMSRLIDASRDRIEAEATPSPSDGLANAESLAAALIWMNERCFHVQSLVKEPAFADDGIMLNALAEIWTRVVYGGAPLAVEPAAASTEYLTSSGSVVSAEP